MQCKPLLYYVMPQASLARATDTVARTEAGESPIRIVEQAQHNNIRCTHMSNNTWECHNMWCLDIVAQASLKLCRSIAKDQPGTLHP